MKKNVFLIFCLVIFSVFFTFSAAAAEEESGFLIGDSDRSGFLSVEDARGIMRCAVKLREASAEELPYMDADGDGSVTVEDSRLALRIALGLDETEMHDYLTTVGTAAGCLTEGEAESVCANCGKTVKTAVPAVGHDYKKSSQKAATCTAAGYSTVKCSRCGDTVKTEKPATGHNYKVSTTRKATCTKDGYTEKKCSRCGDTVRKDTKALGHSWKGSPKKCTRCDLTKEGWVTVNGNEYYYYSDGTCAKNRIIGTKYVDETGVYANDATINAAVKFVNANSNEKDSASVRLSTCYRALMRKCSYKTTYGIPGAANMSSLAYSMLTTYSGNCYKYAVAFAYIARVLGYDSAVETGQVFGHNGFYNLHGWTKVKMNGTWYMFDAMMQDRWGDDCYKETAKSYPYRFIHGSVYKLTVENGVASWA